VSSGGKERGGGGICEHKTWGAQNFGRSARVKSRQKCRVGGIQRNTKKAHEKEEGREAFTSRGDPESFTWVGPDLKMVVLREKR